MKKLIPFLLIAAMVLTGCGAENTAETAAPTEGTPITEPVIYPELVEPDAADIAYQTRFDGETVITLSDDGLTVNGGGETDTVYTSHDIVYYEEKTAYESGYPYGEGTEADMHSADEAATHTVVNITAPGAYRISGKLSAGQIRIDLGEDAYYDENAIVELILDGADITCTVAPAILFQNVYECDGEWSTDTAKAEVDTTAAGANLILEGENTVSGSYVARIYKDKEGEKKLWKQDGAIYSYMSLNVYGPGSLDLTAANEGLDTEMHLTINGGHLAIRSDNDGINTNEDGVSVTTINAGSLHIIAGLGAEGDGIDSNGYLVINGGTVVASANPAADAGLDSDMGSYINGGTVIALGSTMDWAESDSGQVTMNLQFSQFQSSGSAVVVTQEDGTVVFAYDPSEDEVLGENTRQYQGAIVSCPNFVQDYSYNVYMDGTVTGEETGGVYTASTVTAYEGGTQMMYTGTDVVMGRPGGFGGMGGQRPEMPEGFNPGEMAEGEMPTMPEGFEGQMPGGGRGEIPEGFEGEMPTMPADWNGEIPEDFTMPADWNGEMPEGEAPELPEGETMPEGFGGQFPGGNWGQGGFSGMSDASNGNTSFYMQDMVNFFSGLTAVTK